MHFKAICLTVGASVLGLALCAAEPDLQTTNPTAGKSYQIRNRQYGELLRPQDANSANGTPIVLYSAQPWKCMTWKLSSGGESRFYLQNYFTSKTFAAATATEGQPAGVTQVPFGKSPDERPVWQFTRLADGTFKVMDAKTGMVLTASKDGSGVKVTVQRWSERNEQKWELTEIDPKSLTM
jgi:hypothetical protein